MKKISIKAAVIAVATISLAACQDAQFHVEGTMAQAKDSMLYLENVGLEGIVTIDSVRLDADGGFSFSGEAPEAPDFYRLRIYDQIINLSIDSTETVTVKAAYPQMAAGYEVSGSDNCQKIKELAVKQIALQGQLIQLERSGLDRQVLADSAQQLIAAYKDDVKTNYIFVEPNKPYAYFALFQTIGPWLIFDPKTNADDIKVFAAVATSWDTYYPGALRGKNLHNITIEGMKNVRIVEARQQQLDPSMVVESGVIDIELADNQGQLRRLTDLKGKVVLLDFHLFGMKDSPARILTLRDLYNKYHAQGLEIFQVSLDSDEHFWKQTTMALPWISVRDADGIDSRYLPLYNISNLPEFFLIDRDNNLVKRSSQMTDPDAEIKTLL
jgi:hypothetical protein